MIQIEVIDNDVVYGQTLFSVGLRSLSWVALCDMTPFLTPAVDSMMLFATLYAYIIHDHSDVHLLQ